MRREGGEIAVCEPCSEANYLCTNCYVEGKVGCLSIETYATSDSTGIYCCKCFSGDPDNVVIYLLGGERFA